MAELNVNLPEAIFCKVRREFLHDLQQFHGEVEDCVVFGVQSYPNHAFGFHVLTDCGAVISNVPISALVHREDFKEFPLDFLQLWDCFGVNVSAIVYDVLSGARCSVFMKDKSEELGQYLFTLEHWSNDYSNEPSQKKCFHMIQLDSGMFALQPNNRLRFMHPWWVVKDMPSPPTYKVNTHRWRCETQRKWRVADSNDLYYAVESQENAQE